MPTNKGWYSSVQSSYTMCVHVHAHGPCNWDVAMDCMCTRYLEHDVYDRERHLVDMAAAKFKYSNCSRLLKVLPGI